MPPKRFSTSSGGWPAISKARIMMSGRWLRIAPEHSSAPLQTMSYWNALMVSGSCVFSASSPPCGMLNGLWLKSTWLVSSLSSNIGKSVIQQKRNAPVSMRPSSSPSRVRTVPANFAASSTLAGDEEHRVARVQAARRADRLGAIGFQVARDRPLGRPRHRRCSPGRRRPRPSPSRSACRRSCAAAPRRPAPGRRARRRPRRRCGRTARSPSRRSAG